MARGRTTSPARGRTFVRATIGLLEHGRPEASCAAAIVLGELRAFDLRVRRALARRLVAAPSHLRPYIQEALARTGDEAVLAALASDLRRTGVVREQAACLLAGHGDRALAHLDYLVAAHPGESLRHVFGIGGRIATPAAATWLGSHFETAAPARARALGRVLAPRAIMAWPRPARRALRACLTDLVQRGRFRSAEAVRVVLDLLSACPDSNS